MHDRTAEAIKYLSSALQHHDRCKESHAETTAELTEAKKAVDLAARAVVDAELGAMGLFDELEPEAAEPAKRNGRRASHTVAASP